ncbi:MAG: CoA pyrophosphatase [Gammaproteobacteria bacterium]|nr:CoA pyrophosphatase [Gammaproteobacteria bacterium]
MSPTLFQPAICDLTALDDGALRLLLLARLSAVPVATTVANWRYAGAAPAERLKISQFFPDHPVLAAVLIPLVERHSGLSVLLTRRAGHLRHHAGQISFPGGRIESSDADALDAALRETEEEIGLSRTHVSIIGFLPDHLIISGYRVTPVIGFVAPNFNLKIDTTEVAESFEVPLAFFLDSRNHIKRMRTFESQELEFTEIRYGTHNIWGATAGMLMTLYRILSGVDL